MSRGAKLILLALSLTALLTAYYGILAFRGNPSRPVQTVTSRSSRDSYLRLAFDTLSGFPFNVYEVVNPAGGRPLIQSTNSIPPSVKAYDGKAVTVRGYVLALRLRKGLVQEFLLLRDQGTCCFGEAAQINHFIRVNLKGEGFKPGTKIPVEVSGILHVGETYVQGYLTGIYAMEGHKVTIEP